MHIEYLHASKFGNGAMVARAFAERVQIRGVDVDIEHIDEVDPEHLPPADLYVFSSPGRFGKPIKGIRRFLKDLRLPRGTHTAIFTTEIAPKPDRSTGRVPTEEELCRFQKVRPIMHELLQAKGFPPVAEGVVHVTDIKGPLEDGWQEIVAGFADEVLIEEHAAAVG